MGTFKLFDLFLLFAVKMFSLFSCLSVPKKHIDIRYSLAFNLIFDVFGNSFLFI